MAVPPQLPLNSNCNLELVRLALEILKLNISTSDHMYAN